MRKIFFIIFIILYLLYNTPTMTLFGLMSIWYWDAKYIDGFFDGMVEAFDSINPL